MKWEKQFPTEAGLYWFYGERYGRNKFNIDRGDEPLNELILCKCIEICGGYLIFGNGEDFGSNRRNEFGEHWAFAKAETPHLPNFPGKIYERNLLFPEKENG